MHIRVKLMQLKESRSGNFGILTAVLLPVLVGVAGIAIDINRAIDGKNNLQAIADAATLAAATAMVEKKLSKADSEELARDVVISQLIKRIKKGDETPEELEALKKAIREGTKLRIETQQGSGNFYTVAMTTSYNVPLSPLLSLLGKKELKISVSSASEAGRYGRAPLSIYLVLDRPYSMANMTEMKNPVVSTCKNYTEYPNRYHTNTPCYIRQIEALKMATVELFSQLDESDPDNKLIRVGAASYHYKTDDVVDIDWDRKKASEYTADMDYGPGTDASEALQYAYDALKVNNTTEKRAHTAKGNKNFERVIVLMTDGLMSGYTSGWNKTIDKEVRTLCDNAKLDMDENGNGIKIMSVAYNAPPEGKSLLEYCASSPENYFEKDTVNELIETFGKIGSSGSRTSTRLTH